MRQDKRPLHRGKHSLIIRKMRKKTTVRYHSLPPGRQTFKSQMISSFSKMWNKDKQ